MMALAALAFVTTSKLIVRLVVLRGPLGAGKGMVRMFDATLPEK